MRRILVVDDDSHTRLAIGAWLGATRCLCKPFRPATLLNIIDVCPAEAEPHRRQAAAFATITASARPDRGGASREDSDERAGTG